MKKKSYDHDQNEETGAYAYMLSRMENEGGPVPLGILRQINKPVFEQSVESQVSDAQSKKDPDLDSLLRTGDIWEHK